MAARIKLRRGSTALWAARNPVLALGEPGYDTDLAILKIGNGVDAWDDLPEITGGGGGGGDHGGLTGLSDDDHAQYHNDARGDARYWQLSTDLATQSEFDAHLTDADDAHDASAISTSGATPSNVQVVLDDHEGRIGTLEGQVFADSVIIASPDLTLWRLTIDNAGVITTTEV